MPLAGRVAPVADKSTAAERGTRDSVNDLGVFDPAVLAQHPLRDDLAAETLGQAPAWAIRGGNGIDDRFLAEAGGCKRNERRYRLPAISVAVLCLCDPDSDLGLGRTDVMQTRHAEKFPAASRGVGTVTT